jgi:RNA polymerase sigma-B factor
MVAAAPLLREWDWLQEHIVPPLLASRAPRPARTWSIGSTADAVAVTVAFAHAAGSRSEGFQAFASGAQPEFGNVSFGRADVGVLPPETRSAWFRREDRRWVPESVISDQVILGPPGEFVDLVTVRHPDASTDVSAAVGQLKRGGHLLFVQPPEHPPKQLRPVDSEGRLFRKDARSRPPAHDVRPGNLGDQAADDDPTTNLTRHQMQQDLVTHHVRLARALARRFLHRGEPADELEQVAYLALIKASHRFDPQHNATFATYATVSILGELKRHFRDKTWMLRVPRSTQELYLSIKDAREELGHQLGAPPTVAQIARHLEVTEELILEAMEAGGSYWTASLDVRGPDGERSIDIPVTDRALDRTLDRERLRVLLPRLDDREQLILRRLFFDGYTQQRVADELGASQMQISRLLARIITKLRHGSGYSGDGLAAGKA